MSNTALHAPIEDVVTTTLPNGNSCAIPASSPLAKLAERNRTWQGPDAKARLKILRTARSVAIVGASPNTARSSYFVSTYLLSSSDYRVYFVNPRATEILGHPVYPDLASLPRGPGHRRRVPQGAATSPLGRRRDDRRRRGRRSGSSSASGTRRPRSTRRPGASPSSWTAASRSSTPASTAASICSASTRARSPRARRSADGREFFSRNNPPRQEEPGDVFLLKWSLPASVPGSSCCPARRGRQGRWIGSERGGPALRQPVRGHRREAGRPPPSVPQVAQLLLERGRPAEALQHAAVALQPRAPGTRSR